MEKIMKSCTRTNTNGNIVRTELYNKNGMPIIYMNYDGSYEIHEYDSDDNLIRHSEYGKDSILFAITEFTFTKTPSGVLNPQIKIKKYADIDIIEKTIKTLSENGDFIEEYYLMDNITNKFKKVKKLPSERVYELESQLNSDNGSCVEHCEYWD